MRREKGGRGEIRGVINLFAATPVHNRLNDLYPLFSFLNIYTDFSQWKWQVLNEIKRSPTQGFARLQTLIQV